ncbi:MAG TPA: hypothetical protein VMV15_07505, partial [Candidatus Binataceae bacterium]|nr:hypothetical protein [Candidatus Binataceae bacterium]
MVATLLLTLLGARANRAWADPLTVPPASSSWERFTPTLELPRIYNPDGSLPSGAEMPGAAAVMPEAEPATALPPPDAIDPSAAPAPSSASAPAAASAPSAASGPMVTNGDLSTGGAHDAGAAQPVAGNDDGSSDPDPESALNAPSTLDPSPDPGTQNAGSRTAQNQPAPTDPFGNPIGDAQDYQEDQIDPPAVVLIPAPYYAPRRPFYGYPYYGPRLGRYSYFGRAYPHPAAPPAYRGIGSSPPWTAI